MQWVYRLVVDGRDWGPAQSRTGALPLERSRWSTGATFKCIHAQVCMNALSELCSIYIYI